MRHLTTILFVLLLPLALFAGNGTWEKQLNILDVQTSTIYGIQETNRTSGQDTKLVSKFSGYIFLDYTRKELSDLNMSPMASAWNVKVTYHVVGDLTPRYLNIRYENGNYIYSDYNTVATTNNGFEVVIDKIDGNYLSTTDLLWHYTGNAAACQEIPNDIDIRLELRTETIYAMDPGVVADQSRMGFNTSSYRVNWSYVEGAEWYDLEWVFIDDLSLEKTKIATVFGTSVSTEFDYPFEIKEPTRVRVWGTNFTIDKAYATGTLYFRVRSVSNFTDNGSAVDQIKLGSWNYFYDPANYGGSIDVNDIVKYTIGTPQEFEANKNWAYSVTFADGGKSVSSITYYDGSHRSRQNIAYNTSDHVSLVGESKYDREGRQTISVIPAPVAGRQLLYRNDFNLAGDGTAFDEPDYDFESSTATVTPLSTTGSGTRGAAQYFSPNNTFSNDLYRSAIPDAGGYVFSQTIYRNDGTGRIERVGGIGQEFQAGGTHAIQTFYGSPTIHELKRLFGTNISNDMTGYRKTMVRDQNGQYNVSYFDKRGHIIATGLAGNAPNALRPIEGSVEETVTTDMSDNNIVVNGNQIISEHTFLSTIDNNVITLNYSLTGLVTALNAQTVTVGNQELSIGSLCATCHYDLTIKVLDNVGANAITPITTSIDPGGCAAATYSYTSPPIPLGLAGEYRIIKILTVDNDAMFAAFNELLESQGLTNSQTFIDGYLQQVDLSGCFDDCDAYCTALWQLEYIQDHPGAQSTDAVAAWNNLSPSQQETILAECGADVCNPDEVNDDFDYPGDEEFTACSMLHEAALEQISPGGIFYDNVNSSFWNSVPSSVTINGNTYSKSSLQIPGNYTDEIADYMLRHYHRESCHLEFCEDWDASNHYSIGLTAVIQNEPWNISSNTFVEPYNNDVYGWTHDPLQDANAFNGTGLLANPVDNFMTIQYNLSVTNGTPWGCGSSWATSGNLADYVAAYTDCMVLLNPSMTPSEIEQMRKGLFLGLYNQIKEDLIQEYKSGEGCTYYSDDYALFHAPLDQQDMEALAAELTSNILNGQTCAQKAWNQVNLWMGQLPTDCLLQWGLVQTGSNGQLEPTYTEQHLIDAYANGAESTLTEYFYAYSMETCEMNTWGWFYDPQSGPGSAEYAQIQSILSECLDLPQPPPFEVTTPTFTTVSVLNQQFPDCFLGFLEAVNDGFTALNNCTLPCTSGITVDVTTANYPAMGLACDDPNVFPGELTIAKSGGTYVIHYEAERVGGCEGSIPLQLYQAPSYPLFPSTLAIAELTNPVKMVTSSFANIILFDVVLTDGSVVQAFIDMKNLSCFDVGTFKDDQTIAGPGIILDLPDYVQDCIESETAQAEIDAQWLYNQMLQDLQDQYLSASANCLEVTETMSMTYKIKEYQYTLYYYDLADNLVQTVPPQGVQVLSTAQVAANQNPAHKMETRYQYNGLDAVIASYTPDAGQTKVYLDKLYRIRFVQNAQQVSDGKAAYKKYDEKGCVIETGELKILAGQTITDITAQVENNSFPSATRLDYTQISYEQGYTADASIAALFTGGQQNLRNAIGAVIHHQIEYDPAVTSSVSVQADAITVISYSYDVQKSIKQVVTTNYQLTGIGQQHKLTDYTYDAYSGMVNEVVYQKNKPDEYRHRYHYDANNRLVRAFTSKNGVVWEMDEKYFYYLHGALARVETGHDKVQGTDYAYNLQGWLKGVNSASLTVARDLGQDGHTGLNKWSGMDAMGYQLGYYTGDYAGIGTGENTIQAFVNTDGFTVSNENNESVPEDAPMWNLYNGNITHVVTALRDGLENPLELMGNNYQYDQLQRIRRMYAFEGADVQGTNSFAGATYYNGGAYNEQYTFDKNGNLSRLIRNGSGLSSTGTPINYGMDDMRYWYEDGAGGYTLTPTETNRLARVEDQYGAFDALYATDINSGQAANNYQYNSNGQLVKDLQEGVELIEWTPSGKVKRIKFTSASGKKEMKFIYDPMDRRVAKMEYQNTAHSSIRYTYYSYDVSGNVLATYTRTTLKIGQTASVRSYTDEYRLSELHVCGAGRIGMEEPNQLIVQASISQPVANSEDLEKGTGFTWSGITPLANDPTVRVVGDKMYELTNHLGNVLSVISDRKIPMNTSTQFSATTEGWTPEGTAVLTLNAGQLKVVTTGTWKGAKRTFATIPGQRYIVKSKIGDGGSVAVHTYIDDVSTGTRLVTKVHHVGIQQPSSFVATGTQTKVSFVANTSATFYLDDIVIEEANVTGTTLPVQTFSAAGTAGWTANGTSTLSTPGGASGTLDATLPTGTSALMSRSFTTVPGQHYVMKFDVNLNGSLYLESKTESGGTNVVHSLYGNYMPSNQTFAFKATGATTNIVFYYPTWATPTTTPITFRFDNFELVAVENTQEVRYTANVINYSDYSPYGTLLDHRNGTDPSVSDVYRYGFQGQERDDEIKGAGNSYNYEYRMHDPRIGRFFACDPLEPEYAYYSPYQFSGNELISRVELEGLEPGYLPTKIGQKGLGSYNGKLYEWKAYGNSTGIWWNLEKEYSPMGSTPSWMGGSGSGSAKKPASTSKKTTTTIGSAMKSKTTTAAAAAVSKKTNNNSVGFDYAKHGSYKYDGKDSDDECYKAVNRMIVSMGFEPQGNTGEGTEMWLVTKKGAEDATREAGKFHGVSLDIPRATQQMEKAYTALQNGIPVNLGVDFQKSDVSNSDQVTDHFVLAIGYGYDEKKKQRYIQFVDVIKEKEGIDESYNNNPNNRLYEVSPGVWQGISNGGKSSKQWYTVTNVRIAKKKKTS